MYFDNKPVVPSNLTLYGGVPQCTGEMDVKQVCLFVQDSVEGEFKGIINYSIIALIQIEKGLSDTADLGLEEASNLFKQYANKANPNAI